MAVCRLERRGYPDPLELTPRQLLARISIDRKLADEEHVLSASATRVGQHADDKVWRKFTKQMGAKNG